MKYVFTCDRHEEFGSNGWRLKTQPDFDPLGGMAVAHDILEHFPGGDGSPSDELMALGASLHVRDGYHQNGSAGYNIGGDLPELMRHVFYENMSLRPAPITKPCDAEVEAEISAALDVLETDLEYWSDDQEIRTTIKRYYADMRGWMRLGYRKAKKRFKGLRRDQIQSLFYTIEHEADRVLKMAEEGAELTVSVTLSSLSAKITWKEAYELEGY